MRTRTRTCYVFIELNVDTKFDLCTANLSLQFLVDSHDLFIVMVSITLTAGSTFMYLKNTYYSFLINSQRCSEISQKFNAGQRATFPFTYVLLLSLMHLIHISLFILKLMITVKNPLITQPSTRKKGVKYSIHPTILVIIYRKDPRNTKKCSILHVHVSLFPNSLLSLP